MFGSVWGVLKTLIQPAVSLVLLPWLHGQVIQTQRDQRRFDLISAIAEEAAAEAVQRLPGSDEADLIRDVVEQVSGSFPTSNEKVLYRAVSRAVREAVRNYRDEGPPTSG